MFLFAHGSLSMFFVAVDVVHLSLLALAAVDSLANGELDD